jgi:ATP-dependent Lon protease
MTNDDPRDADRHADPDGRDGRDPHANDTTVLPLLPLRQGVLFPGTVITLPVGRAQSLALLDSVAEGDRIAVGAQRDPRVEDPSQADLFDLGTIARIRQMVRPRTGFVQLVLEGERRIRIDRLVGSTPFWRAALSPVFERAGDAAETRALAELLLERVSELAPAMSDQLRESLDHPVTRQDPGRVADMIAGGLGLDADKESRVLLALDVPQRLRIVLALTDEVKTLAELKTKLADEVREGIGKHQREAMLREQLRAIKRELGEDNEDAADVLRERLEAAVLPDEVREVVNRQLRRLEETPPAQAEAQVIRSYLELIAELPWTDRAEISSDIDGVARKLDDDHYGLNEVKERILEHLAVHQVTGSKRGAVMCLAGPPGVGKTSLGQSIAEATNRPFVRVSLGGVRDEAEVRGHRRTYVGALPGRIISALRRAGAKNPLVLLDEIDKLGQGWMGSPEAALLEVLDPEQNSSFTDHYLELPFDLSEVLFVCTANSLANLSAPLRDRLEIIELEGYTGEEKAKIAERHLLPALRREHGLGEDALSLAPAALQTLLREYTREAGVRQLKRELTRICRATTLRLARAPEGKAPALRLEPDQLSEFLGKPRFFNEVAERTALPGVVTGLAWTPAGGDILFIETSRMPGKGRLEITGQLGDVMKESARAALTYLRSHADQFGLDPSFLEQQDLHVHVPAGAVPKDGPSAGVAIFTALASLLGGRRARADTAMTGEITLRGRVLPIGGVKHKVLAAHRAGISRVLLPEKNRRDLDDVPAAVREQLEVLFVDDLSQVLAAALEHGEPTPHSGLGDQAAPETAAQPAAAA